MSEPFFKNSNDRLVRAYIALTLAQDATERWLARRPDDEALRGLATTLNVTAGLLESLLEEDMDVASAIPRLDMQFSETIM